MNEEELNNLPIKINNQVVKLAGKIRKQIKKLNEKDGLGRGGDFLRTMRIINLVMEQERLELLQSDVALIDMKLTLEKYIEELYKEDSNEQ